MSHAGPGDESTLPHSALARTSRACDQFVAEWRSGPRPSVEKYLAASPEADAAVLLRMLIETEVRLRREAGENPSLPEYLDRFAGRRDIVELAFLEPTVTMGSQARGSAMRRPGTRAYADRNLLVAILAWQNRVIEDNALVEVVRAWTEDKTKQVGRLLLERGHLDERSLAVLEAMVDRQLQVHGFEPARSLGAVDDLGPVRRDLGMIEDDDVQAALACVGGSTPETEEDLTTPFPVGKVENEATTPRFRVLSPYARGGLGEVSIAMDREFQRKVAFKQIRGPRDRDPESRARFLLEAELTGRLEHPGIVPVYGLGVDDDGRPYYAMRFIKGDSLREAIARFHRDDSTARSGSEKAIELRRLLGRFIDVCYAIEYAHKRGVLHRDLKPGNIMLGKYGETLVVDWGVAKVLGSRRGTPDEATEGPIRPAVATDSWQTSANSVCGTLHYMSPEQAAGRIDQLGWESDVFSLGATLYCVLTGRAPYRGNDFTTLLGKVKRGEFPPPRQVRREVPPALEAICLKAMSLERADRYPTARALADDVDRWLADEPVRAYREPLLSRSARWVRHHKPWVAGAAALLVASSLGLAVYNFIIRGERDRADLARKVAVTEREAAIAARDREQKALAQSEADFRLAQAAVTKFLEQVGEIKLADMPKAEPIRRELVGDALTFFEDLRKDRPADNDLRRTAAMAYREYANIQRRMNDFLKANEYYEKASKLYDELMLSEPGDEKNIELKLRCSIDRAESLRMAGKYKDAFACYEDALARVRELKNTTKQNTRLTLARAQYNYASALIDAGRFPEAKRPSEQSSRSLAGLVGESPKYIPYRLVTVIALRCRGTVYREEGKFDEAIRSFDEALSHLDYVVTLGPDNKDVLYLRAGVLVESGKTLARMPDGTGKGIQSVREAVALNRKLVEQNDTVGVYKAELAGSLIVQAELLESEKFRASEVAGIAEEAVNLLERAIIENPVDPVGRGRLGRGLGIQGRLALAAGDKTAALALFRHAVEEQRHALEDFPNNPIDERALAKHLEAIKAAGG